MRQSSKRAYTFNFLIILTLIGVSLAIWVIPKRIVKSASEGTVQLTTKELVELENSTRLNISQIIGGAFAIVGVFMAGRNIAATERNVMVAYEGQITSRFAKSIEQLESKNLQTRLGAIYTLEAIAKDSDRLHWPAIEILTAFIRQEASWHDTKVLENSLQSKDKEDTNSIQDLVSDLLYKFAPSELIEKKQEVVQPESTRSGSKVSRRTDIQAAITVIGRRVLAYEKNSNFYVDLSKTDLRGYDFSSGHFEKADFSEAHLEGANFIGAHLEGAALYAAYLNHSCLIDAHLEKADLKMAKLDAADLSRAHLNGAILVASNLERALLISSDLRRATLREATLREATLTSVDLKKADLTGADFERATVKNLKGLTQQQIETAINFFFD